MMNAMAMKLFGMMMSAAEGAHAVASEAEHVDAAAHPSLPEASHWPVQMWIVIGVMFGLAIVAGMVYRPKVEAEPVAHDDGHGHSAGHH